MCTSCIYINRRTRVRQISDDKAGESNSKQTPLLFFLLLLLPAHTTFIRLILAFETNFKYSNLIQKEDCLCCECTHSCHTAAGDTEWPNSHQLSRGHCERTAQGFRTFFVSSVWIVHTTNMGMLSFASANGSIEFVKKRRIKLAVPLIIVEIDQPRKCSLCCNCGAQLDLAKTAEACKADVAFNQLKRVFDQKKCAKKCISCSKCACCEISNKTSVDCVCVPMDTRCCGCEAPFFLHNACVEGVQKMTRKANLSSACIIAHCSQLVHCASSWHAKINCFMPSLMVQWSH